MPRLESPCYSSIKTSPVLPACRWTWGNAENLFALLLRAWVAAALGLIGRSLALRWSYLERRWRGSDMPRKRERSKEECLEETIRKQAPRQSSHGPALAADGGWGTNSRGDAAMRDRRKWARQPRDWGASWVSATGCGMASCGLMRC
ncbi:hypothetical protein HDV57DRAFT_73528 [Trichoderma longibrachiatum]|uniref:Uncharacterized protein n=1 Tax=Trichoderma longibrachiatum ATCC 18648 TaxID=983965 RepID=A0A2T4BUQ0_TRILO|nr:hypothetical protein M440DRAFT_1071895 [Trichoderma longibrachiatum ATCC 18648]